MMVVRDVTNTAVSSTSINKKSNKIQSTITPFRKVMEREESRADSGNTDVSGVGSSGSTVSNSGAAAAVSGTDSAAGTANAGSLTGTVTLKDLFKEASEKYDISYDFLVAVAKAESDFNTKCVSSAGAKGIMQLMPDECKEFGVTDPFDARQNIMASAKLLKAHLKKFNGDFTLAAAAYNAGSGAVKRYGGVPPYTETQNYVKKIAKFMASGVTVPDRTVTADGQSSGGTDSGASAVLAAGGSAASDTGSSANPVSASGSSGADTKAAFEQGMAATDDDWQKVLISVGTGSEKVTMTYGAYLKYLELGTTGVG